MADPGLGDAACEPQQACRSPKSPEPLAPQASEFSNVLCHVTHVLREAHEQALAGVVAENAQLKRANAVQICSVDPDPSDEELQESQFPVSSKPVETEQQRLPAAHAAGREQLSTAGLEQQVYPIVSVGPIQKQLAALPPMEVSKVRSPLTAANAGHKTSPEKRELTFAPSLNETPFRKSAAYLVEPPELPIAEIPMKGHEHDFPPHIRSSATSQNSLDSLNTNGSTWLSPYAKTVADVSLPPMPGNVCENNNSVCKINSDGSIAYRSKRKRESQCMTDFMAEENEAKFQLGMRMNMTASAALGHNMQVVFHAWAYHADRMQSRLDFKPYGIWSEAGEPSEEHRASLVDQMMMQQTASEMTRRFTSEGLMGPVKEGSCAEGGILFPNSPVRLTWDIFGALLLGFDIIVIPMSAFTNERNDFMLFMDWFTLIFWTGDIAASCRTGYVHEGATILKARSILLHYLRTWFVLDLIVVVPDWIFTVTELTSGSEKGGGSSGSKLLRALRVVRMSRVLRLCKLSRVMAVLRDRIDSEFLFIIVNIIKLILLLLVVNHFLSSIWYAIGELGLTLGAENWINAHGFKGRPLGERYTVALHWTLTQFTPASMDVQPRNTGERSFAITVLVCGLVLFSSFISSITNSMTQLRSMDDDKSKQFWLLRRYLRQYKIQTNLAFRILRHVEFSCNNDRELIPESKIWILTMLSEQLRSELQFSVSYSCMLTHPLFDCLTEVSRMTMVKLCAKALSIRNHACTDVMFLPGTVQTEIHYLECGRASYEHVDHHDESHDLLHKKTEWICEPALWTEWVTLGSAHAVTECKIVSIDSKSFGQVISKDAVAWFLTSKYAMAFSSWLSTVPRGSLTDICESESQHDILDNILQEVERMRVYQQCQHMGSASAIRRQSSKVANGISSTISNHFQGFVKSRSNGSMLSKRSQSDSSLKSAKETTSRRTKIPFIGKMLDKPKPSVSADKRMTSNGSGRSAPPTTQERVTTFLNVMNASP